MARNIEDYLPPLKEDGLVTAENATIGGTLAVTGTSTFTGVSTFTASPVFSSGTTKNVESISAATEAVAAADSGKMYVDVLGSGTTTFTLPSAAAGLSYTFVCGSAAGEILITPASGDAIVTKIHSAQDGTALAPAAGTGIKNTAATNVAGDSITLTALDATTWYGTSIIGLWASQ